METPNLASAKVADRSLREVSERAFYYTQHNLRELRYHYCKARNASFARVAKLPRDFIVRHLLIRDFGEKLVNEYEQQAEIWREEERQAVQQWTENIESESV